MATPYCRSCEQNHFNFWTCQRAKDEAEKEARKWIINIDLYEGNTAEGLWGDEFRTLTHMGGDTYAQRIEEEE